MTLYEMIRDLAIIGAAGDKGCFVNKSQADRFRASGLEGVIEPIDELGLCWRLTPRGQRWMRTMMDITAAAVALGADEQHVGKDDR